jgi:EAL domain-containing protein (putative c-di-GMP-specific phosphodiesterase class I)
MAEPIESSRKPLRWGRGVRLLLPSLATLSLAALLVFTIFFTLLEWQWIAFLSGMLFAAVLSLISASWKAQWGMAQSTEQQAQIRERLAVETAMHRGTSERLDRELALHQQDRERLAKETEALRAAGERASAAEGTLRMLERFPTAACFVDSELRCRFHTRTFAAWIGKHSAQIDGHPLDELFDGSTAEALRAAIADALAGRTAHAELSTSMPGAAGKQVMADLVPHRGGSGQVTGIMMAFEEAAATLPPPHPEALDAVVRHEDAVRELAGGLLVTDETGNAVYLSSITEELTGWSDPQTRIRNAIDQDGFDLHAQDIVPLRPELRPRRMLELLIRMRDEEEHHLPPGAFFPAAEHFELMPDIDRWVVKKIVAAIAATDAARRKELPLVCINTARSTIADRAFPEFVARTLEQARVPAHLLCFEIADSDVIAGLADAARFAGEMKRLGCHVSLDGFGSAGVGFDHVKSLPLDFLKIDGRIIFAIARDPVAAAKVAAIRRVCRGIGVRTIAEMVESEEVRQKLAALEVDYAQGFGIALPRPLGALEWGSSGTG